MENSFSFYLLCNNQWVYKCESKRSLCFGFLTPSVLSRVHHCKRWPTKIWQLGLESVFHSDQLKIAFQHRCCPSSTSICFICRMFWTGMCCGWPAATCGEKIHRPGQGTGAGLQQVQPGGEVTKAWNYNISRTVERLQQNRTVELLQDKK